MIIYKRTEKGKFEHVPKTTFDAEDIKEDELEAMLEENMEKILPDILIFDKQFNSWKGSMRRMDLLGIDKDANLVVIELKRTEDGGHIELQAIRYAAMISKLTFDELVDTFTEYSESINSREEAQEKILDFLKWDEPNEEDFAQEVKIILVSMEFSKEVTTSVMWLNECGLDIRCIRMQPYKYGKEVLLKIQPIIPFPDTEEYQINVKRKNFAERESRRVKKYNRYDVNVGDQEGFNLPANGMIWFIVSNTLASGHGNPEDINSEFQIFKKSRVFRSFEGELSLEEVKNKLPTNRIRRYFLRNRNDIKHHEGKTYFFTKNWTQEQAEKAAEHIIHRLQELNISFEKINH